MVRPAVIPQWERSIYRMLAAQPSASAKNLRDALSRAFGQAPSERTVGRIKAAFGSLTPEKQRSFGELRWPEAMETGDLPWEASTTIFELIREVTPRPDLGLGIWFWRITLAVPDAPFPSRVQAARQLLARELLGRQSSVEDLEAWLAYAPWRSNESYRVFEGVVASGMAHDGPLDEWLASTGTYASETPSDVVKAALRALGWDDTQREISMRYQGKASDELRTEANDPNSRLAGYLRVESPEKEMQS